MKPVLKWVGGKTQLLSEIRKRIPPQFNTYYEPFVGGGAVLFDLAPNEAVIGDMNSELINLYTVIKDSPEALILDLQKHENTSEYFYALRSADRDSEAYHLMPAVQKASRIVYLNKTCYNGLYRVNSRGELNAPFGRYKNPKICDEANITAISKFFNNSNIKMRLGDFEKVVKDAKAGDFVYLDPPYDPVSESANFTGYNANGFSREDQIRLKECCDRLNEKGVYFLLSNSATSFIQKLYKDYSIDFVEAKRAINCKGEGRAPVFEVLVRNYD